MRLSASCLPVIGLVLLSGCALDWSRKGGGEDLDAAASLDAAISSSPPLGDASSFSVDATTEQDCENECGGPCGTALEHMPGLPCDNGLKGVCAKSGVYTCNGPRVVCTAELLTAGLELCGDNLDNDCDGLTDEPDAVDAPTWYRDCDGDGYINAVQASQGTRSCIKPAAEAGCAAWLSNANTSSLDCDDLFSARHPGAAADYPWSSEAAIPDPGSLSFDIDCSGKADIVDGVYATYELAHKILFTGCDTAPINDLGCCAYESSASISGCGYGLNATLDCATPGGGDLYQAKVTGWYVCK